METLEQALEREAAPSQKSARRVYELDEGEAQAAWELFKTLLPKRGPFPVENPGAIVIVEWGIFLAEMYPGRARVERELTAEQRQAVMALRQQSSARVVFGALSPDGTVFKTHADPTRQRMHRLAREGWTVERAE